MTLHIQGEVHMESTPRLYETLIHVLSQPRNWVDRGHFKTLAWMMVGLVQSRLIYLTAWAPSVQSRAVYAQSHVLRFDRWLDNTRINVHPLDGPLIQQASADWGTNVLPLALDASMLWDVYWLVCPAVIARGRAIPLVSTVLHQPSRNVAWFYSVRAC